MYFVCFFLVDLMIKYVEFKLLKIYTHTSDNCSETSLLMTNLRLMMFKHIRQSDNKVCWCTLLVCEHILRYSF